MERTPGVPQDLSPCGVESNTTSLLHWTLLFITPKFDIMLLGQKPQTREFVLEFPGSNSGRMGKTEDLWGSIDTGGRVLNQLPIRMKLSPWS